MRCLVHETQYRTIASRCTYLYDIFHLYFLPHETEHHFIQLKPVGQRGESILFITGHQNQVDYFLRHAGKDTPEDTIVITSCMSAAFAKYTFGKRLYVPRNIGPLCKLRDGKVYGFDFDISDEELDFYNASGSVWDRLEKSYWRIT